MPTPSFKKLIALALLVGTCTTTVSAFGQELGITIPQTVLLRAAEVIQ